MPSPDVDSKAETASVPTPPRQSVDETPHLLAAKSPGVIRVEAISKALTLVDRVFIFVGIFFLAFCFSLDGTLRYAYQPTATASYSTHALLATINVVRAVVAAAAQPTAARIADVFGRVELIIVSVIFYVVGTIIESVAYNVQIFCGGAVLYQIGYTMLLLLVEVIIGDTTSTRARLLFSYIPALPYLITTWVSGNISAAVLANTTWNWGIGMWGIIVPISSLPLIVSLIIVSRRAKKQGLLDHYQSPFLRLGFKRLMVELFWQLDVIGIILLVAVFALILVPLTIAGGFQEKWRSADTIAPIVIGILCIPAFLLWELKTKNPIAPFSLMKDRGIWAALSIACFLNWSWAMQGNFLYSSLIVSYGFDIADATRFSSFYSFFSVLSGFFLGFVVYKVRRLKYFIVAGTSLFMVAFGLLIHFRGSPAGQGGVIGAEVVLGIAGGFFAYPTQASLQASLPHERLAVMTGLYLAIYNVGSALGNTVSGAIWSQVLPATLTENLAPFNNATLITSAYGNPFGFVAEYPMGTPEREAVVVSYMHVQRMLTITGICLTVPLIVFALLLRNPKLNDKQTLAPESQEDLVHHGDAKHQEKAGANDLVSKV